MPSALQSLPPYASSRQPDPSEPAEKQQINLPKHLRLLSIRLRRVGRAAAANHLQTIDLEAILDSLDLKNPRSLASTMVAGDFLALVSFRLEVFDKLFPYAEELVEGEESTLQRRYIFHGWRCAQSTQESDEELAFNIGQVGSICLAVNEYSQKWSRAGIEWSAEALEEYVDHHTGQSNSGESLDDAPSLELSGFLHWTEHSYLPEQIHKLETTINQETISMNRTSRSLSITANSLSSQADSSSLIEHQVATTLKSQVEYDINTAFVAPLMTDSGEDSESDVGAMASPLPVAESLLGDWSELSEDGGEGET